MFVENFSRERTLLLPAMPTVTCMNGRAKLGVSTIAIVLLAGACSGSSTQRSVSKTTNSAPDAAVPQVSKTSVRLLLTRGGITVPVVGVTTKGFQIITPCGRAAIVNDGTRFGQVEVVIDAGHGGRETGAIANGIRESILNIHVARELQTALKAIGISSALTRSGDYRLPIPIRAKIVNVVRPKLFVSVHHNSGAAADHVGPGTEVYFQRASVQSKRLAGLVWKHMTDALKKFDAHWVGAGDAGAIYRLGGAGNDFYGVLRETAGIPAVLIEPTYISEPSQARLLKTDKFRQAEAIAIAEAIQQYLHTNDQGTGFRVPLSRGGSDPGGGGTTHECKDPKL